MFAKILIANRGEMACRMIAALFLLLAPGAPVAAGPPDITIEEPGFAFSCDDPDLDESDVALCEAEAAANAAAAEVEDAGRDPDECHDPQTQQDMNYCAARDFASADAALNEQWAITVAAMRELDREIDRQYDDQPGHYDTLLEAQRAWLRYRDAQCRSEGFYARGGSMQPMLEAFCRTYMTELRTQQLRDLTAGLGI